MSAHYASASTLWVALASDHSVTFGRLLIVERFEDVAVVMFDLELLEELEIFLAERFARMVSYLVSNGRFMQCGRWGKLLEERHVYRGDAIDGPSSSVGAACSRADDI